MTDTLETLLIQLAAMKERAQQIVAAEYPPDAEFDWDGDHRIWVGMEEENVKGGWCVGWLMQPIGVPYFVIEANGRTPIEAALKLVERMKVLS